MGLNNFLSFIRQNHPDLLQTEHISYFAYQYCFIDIASYLYKYICIMGTNDHKWLNSCLKLISSIKKNKLIPIVIFDGKPPKEKKDEIQERKEAKNKQQARVDKINDLLLSIEQENQIHSTDIEFLRTEISRSKHQMLHNDEQKQKDELSSTEIYILKKHKQSLSKSIFSLPYEERQLFRTILTLCGIQIIDAPHEAEMLCCWFNKQYPSSCVLSCDTDCVAHRAPNVILEYQTDQGSINFINWNKLKEKFEFEDESQMVDFAILIGCDYNKKSRVNKIGPIKGLKFIQEYKTIESIPNISLEPLNVDSCREMFNPVFDPEVYKIQIIQPDKETAIQLALEQKISKYFVIELSTWLTTEILLDDSETNTQTQT